MITIDDTLYDRAHFDSAAERCIKEAGFDRRQSARYAVCFANTVDWLELFFAIRSIGASVLPIFPGTPYPAARRLAVGAGCGKLFYNSLQAEVLSEQEVAGGEGQLLQMSSGTTGTPKCIARNWSEIDREIESYVTAFRAPEAMTPVVACPTTHSYGLICGILVALRRGQTPVILNTANPKYLLRKLKEIDRPLLYSSPAILHTLARLLPSGEKIHAVMTSGTVLPEPWFADIRTRAEHMFQQYGCSEAGCIAINPDVRSAADMGYVLPHHRAEAGQGSTAPGEIVVSNATAAVHTQDLGYLREDGMLVFVSRMDDTINVSGLNVYPKDVEDAVMLMPGISDAVAFRKPDRFAGERVTLIFSATEAINPLSVREWCSRNLASHQLPMEILQVGAVPRQANGKISRRQVAEMHQAGAFAAPAMEAAQ
jgi:fatty-acyl-CoA synthase